MENIHRYGLGDASFQAAGGEAGLTALVERFYKNMDSFEVAQGIRKMHVEDLTVVKDKLARFLCGWLGGPRLFQEKYGPIHIPQFHEAFPIGPAERDAWLACMASAVDEQPWPDDFKVYFMKVIRVPAERVRNRE